MTYHLIGAYTRYSSWTARLQLVLEYHRITYTAEYINLATTRPPTASGLVPALQIPALDGQFLSETLAILEYLAESHPELQLWPQDRKLRALARSAANEMHAGFVKLRERCPSNYWGRYPDAGVKEDDGVLKDVRRVCAIWGDLRREMKKAGVKDEGWLCGEFGIVDAMFWPVLWRIRSFGLPVEEGGEDVIEYVKSFWNEPVVKRLEKESFTVQLEDPKTVEEDYESIYPGMEIIPEGFGSGLETWCILKENTTGYASVSVSGGHY